MKKALFTFLAVLPMVAMMVSCGTTSGAVAETIEAVPPADPVEEITAASPMPVEEFTAAVTEKGIEITGIIPVGTNQVRFYRNDSISNSTFMCGNLAYWPGVGDGTEKTFIDYFVNPGQDYEYEIQVIINQNWNNPKKYYLSVTNGEGGKGEMIATDISLVTVNSSHETVSGITPVDGMLLEGARDCTGINAWTLADNICYFDEVPHWTNLVKDGVLDLTSFKGRPGFEQISMFKVTLGSAQYIRDEENGININYIGRQQVIFDGSNF